MSEIDDYSENDSKQSEDMENSEYDSEEEQNLKKRRGKKLQSQKFKKNKENNFRNKFLDEEALEDSDEESGVSADEIDAQVIKQRALDLKKEQEEALLRKKKQQPEFMKIGNEQELEEYMNNKYSNQNDMVDAEDGEQAYSYRMLPSMSDPKVFAVRCKIGMEKETTITIMNKFIHLMGTPKELLIYSASFIDKFPGYIYIEADKEVYVKQAIQDLSGTYNKIDIIPIKEVPQIYTVDQKRQSDLKIGQWVRIKNGLYEQDLARIVELNDSKTRLKLRIVPRLQDYELDEEMAQKGLHALNAYRRQQQKKLRPPQQFFTQTRLAEARRNTKSDITSYHYQGKVYQNGFLIKQMSVKNITSENVIPTLEEMERFLKGESNEQDKNELLLESLNAIEEARSKINCYEKGDKVRVVEGDLVNLIGVVVNSNPIEVTIQPILEDYVDVMSFSPQELVKYFKEGEHVKIQDGNNKGQTGTIVRLDQRIANIILGSSNNKFLDNQKSEVKCLVNSLKICTEVNIDSEITQGNYKKFDLIRLVGGEKCGVILSLEKDFLQIIDERGNLDTIGTFKRVDQIIIMQQYNRYFKIDQVVNDRQTNIFNNLQHKFSIESTVKVIDGVYKGKIGVVKHIFKNNLFIFNTEFTESAGIFAQPVNNCYLVTNNIHNKYRQIQIAKPPVPQAKFDDTQSHANSDMSKDTKKSYQKPIDTNPLLGKICMIRKGDWKGYEGRVKDSDDKNVRIELLCKSKIITIPKDFINAQEGQGAEQESSNKYRSMATPMHRGGQSVWNPQSPFHGMQSPGFMQSPGWKNMASPAYNSGQR